MDSSTPNEKVNRKPLTSNGAATRIYGDYTLADVSWSALPKMYLAGMSIVDDKLLLAYGGFEVRSSVISEQESVKSSIVRLDLATGDFVDHLEFLETDSVVGFDVGNGILVACVDSDNGTHIYAVDLSSMSIQWDREMEGELAYGVEVCGDQVIVGHADTSYISNKLTVLDLDNGEQQYVINDVLESFLSSDGKSKFIYVSGSNTLTCVETESGEELWTASVGNILRSGIVEDYVFSVSDNGTVSVFDIADGKAVIEYLEVDFSNNVVGKVALGSDADVYSLGTDRISHRDRDGNISSVKFPEAAKSRILGILDDGNALLCIGSRRSTWTGTKISIWHPNDTVISNMIPAEENYVFALVSEHSKIILADLEGSVLCIE